MKRVYLTDWSGRWFDIDKAQKWEERMRHNGQFEVSCATGSPYWHESLYLDTKGRWIVHRTTTWAHISDTWLEISAERAAKWLIVNNYELPDTLREHKSV